MRRPMNVERYIARVILSGLALIGLALFLAGYGIGRATACDRIVMTGLAKHFEDGHYNSVTTGFGCEYARGAWRWGATLFENSHRKVTFLPGASWLPVALGPVRLGVSAGLAIGGYSSVVTPAAAFSAEVMAKDAGIDLSLVPDEQLRKPAVLWLRFKFLTDGERR